MTTFFGENSFAAPAEISDDELTEIGMILSLHRNCDMSVYKSKYMKRRVAIRMRAVRCNEAAEYCALLRNCDLELDLLQKTLTIHVSQFFRNPSVFEKLRTDVMAGLLKARENDSPDPLRFWCLGCAAGEEPYSLAILLRLYFGREVRQVPVSIVGTDVDAETLKIAQQAEYNEDRLKEVSTELREHFFRQHGSRYQLIPEIREMVTFVQGDITSIEQYVKSDLVLCRNTLIYFNRPDQEKILNGIADILPNGGILVLGKSETLVGDARQRFVSVCPVERIYRKL